MKLNLDYAIEKNEQEEKIENEDIISNYIQNYKESQYNELINRNMNLETVYTLSEHRKNIINWYDFNKEASALEIGANLGEVTGELCNKLHKVVAIESSRKKAEAIAKRHEDKENLEIIVGEIEKIPLEEKFDYVILYQPNILKYIKPYVKENTIILLATDNRFGITYFAGSKVKNLNVYETILSNDTSIYSKYEIEEILKQEGYEKYKFYYPLPNYKMPNVIFSDEYLPNENTTKLMYNIMYEKGSIVTFDELKALKQLTKNKQFPMFANSYLIEIATKESANLSGVKFVSYNNNRKSKYQLLTKIYNDKVIKEPINDQAIDHIKNIALNTENLNKLNISVIDKISENKIISPYIEEDTLDRIIIKNILEDKIEEAYEIIDLWYEEIKIKLSRDKKSKLNSDMQLEENKKYKELTILKNGYIDLVFENTFYQEGRFIFFDQEWYFAGIPLEFLLYRAIQNLYSYNMEIQKHISKSQMMQRYGIIQYIELFEKIEEYIQREIIDQKKKDLNNRSLEKLVDANYISIMQNQIEDFKENDIKQNEYIKALEEDNRKKQEYIEMLEKKKK